MRAQLDVASLAQVRFAPSPVLESVFWLGLTAAGARHPRYGDPGPAARFALRDPDIAVAAALTADLVARRYLPDFLTPKPNAIASERVLADQLERICATPADQAHGQLVDARWSSGVMARCAAAGEALPRIAASGIWKFWRSALADDWPGLRRALIPCARHYGRRAAESGIGKAIDELHPSLSWSEDSILVDCESEETVRLIQAEVVLVPSALALTYPTVQTDDPAETVIAFPVRAASWLEPRTRHEPRAALGRGRSSVLVGLARPRTTRQLARTLGLSESTVSHHLHALAGVDLVHSTRRGREVVYSLTLTGHDLRDAVNG